MIENEFDQWLDAHTAAFPSVAEWISRLPDPDATIALWRRALAGTDLANAMAVTDRMAIGELPAPLQWEQRDQTAIIVKREAAKLRGERRWSEPKYDRPLPSRHGGTFTPLRSLLHRAQQLGHRLRAGTLNRDDHDLKMEHLQNEARNGGRESRGFRCCTCEDSGLVLCWHVRSIAVYRTQGAIPQGARQSMAMACMECDSGRAYGASEAAGGRRNPLPWYSPRSHCRLVSGGSLPGQADIDELERWLRKDYMPPAMAGDFAEWNEGAGV